ncbi:dimethyl sulfoxide reductase anchor subunit family protein [Leucothrix arctica]|uniref:DMSO reductase n=1 Tax=Leucothrix arctica TaxID=1481894 RepID=A0A317CGE7_9GAMM|nr:DmsC/YnfH family molybdoenzyme membrane anchor subunit [Leucothrix arctica]PWQ97596.1 DMSO reductase [Leucothrix arctica]
MQPAFSVIAFTVCSGAGFGLYMLLAMAHVLGFLPILSRGEILFGIVLAMVLVIVGLLSSTLHLANPKNAWRAFFRFRTSWLSREGVFAVLFFPFAGLYLLGVYFADMKTGDIGFFSKLMGLFGVMLAFATLFSQGMIYGCLKTIKQWNTPLTPTNYILLAFMTGALLLNVVLAFSGQAVGVMGGITVGLIVTAGISKAIYYYWIRTPSGSSINTATGFLRGNVRLLDVGHTAATFLTDEFGYKTAKGQLNLFKAVVFVCGFFIPFLLTAFSVIGASAAVFSALLAFVIAMVGITAERWLFFAEANHVVNLYHGAQRT